MSASRTAKVVALSLGKSLTTVGLLAAAMIMNRIMTDEGLATYRTCWLYFDVSTSLLCVGLFQGMFYYLPGEKERRRGVVLDGLLLLFGLGLMLSIGFLVAGWIAANWFDNSKLSVGLYYFSALPFATMPAGLIAAILVTQDRVQQLAVYNVCSNLVLVSTLIFTCWWFREALPIIAAKVTVQFLLGVLAIGILWSSLPQDPWQPSLSNMRRMLMFSLPLGAASAFGILQTNLDRLLVTSMCTYEEIVVYTNGAIEIPFIAIVTGSIATVLLPELRRSVAAGDRRKALELFRLAAERSAVLLVPSMALLMVIAEPLMVTLYTEDSRASTSVFRVYLMLLPLRVVVYGSMMVALGLNRTILYRTATAAVINCLLSFFLISQFGYVGAAISTVTTTATIACGWSLLAIRSAIPCKFSEVLPYRKIAELFVLSFLAALPVVFFHLLLSDLQPWAQLILETLVYAVFFVAIAWTSDNRLVLESVKTVRQRLLSRLKPIAQ